MADLLSQTISITETERKIIYEARIHWISYVVPITLMIVGSVGVVLLLGAIISGFLGLLSIIALGLTFLFVKGFIAFMRNKKTRIMLDEKNLSIKTGFLSSSFLDLSLNKLEGMQLFQSFLGKQFNFGSLIVTTGGVTYRYFIKNPMQLREQILKLTHQ